MYAESIESTLRCKTLVDKLEKKYDRYILENELGERKDKHRFLRMMKKFFHEEKAWREKLFEKSRLAGSDCLSMATLMVLLANRKGLKARVGVPIQVRRMLHANVLYRDGGERKAFTIAGRHSYPDARVMPASEIKRRLFFTKPFTLTGAKVKRKIRAFRRRK